MSIELELLPEQYRLGHETIDGQHEILFQLFRELSEYCDADDYELELDFILLSLKTYVATHFRCEEGLMEAAHYENLKSHISEHHALENQVLAQIDRFSTLDNKADIKQFAQEMKSFILNWLLEHIAQTDRKFCQTQH